LDDRYTQKREAMKRNLELLNQVTVAKPCPANWDEMKGNDQVRHCSQCRLNVYNLSEMNSNEAYDFIQQAEGRVCVRLYKRPDGTLITRDCPKGVRAFRRKVVRQFALASSFVLSAIGCGQVGERLKEDFGISSPPIATGKMVVAGAVACPPMPPTSTSTKTNSTAKSTQSPTPKSKS